MIHQNGGPEVLQYEDLRDPVCADDGIVIDVETVSIEGGKTLADRVKVLGWRGRLVSVGIAGRGGSALKAFSLWARNNTLHGVRFATVLPA